MLLHAWQPPTIAVTNGRGAKSKKPKAPPKDCPDFGSRVPRCQRVQDRELRPASRDGARWAHPMAGAMYPNDSPPRNGSESAALRVRDPAHPAVTGPDF